MTNPKGDKTMPKKNKWNDDPIQFARLLAELRACGLTKGQYRFLKDSMDLETENINEILERAEVAFGKIKMGEIRR